MEEEKKEEIVQFFYSCVKCGKDFKVKRIIKAHMMYVHNKAFPAKDISGELPSNDEKNEFQVDENNFHKRYDLKRLGCPSCWSHFDINDKQGYYNHAKQEHPLEDFLDGTGTEAYAVGIATAKGTQDDVVQVSVGGHNSEGDDLMTTGVAGRQDEGFTEVYYDDKVLYTPYGINIMAIVNAELGEICDFFSENDLQLKNGALVSRCNGDE